MRGRNLSTALVLVAIVGCGDGDPPADAASGGAGGGSSETTSGCEEARFLGKPGDPASRGSSPVGARTAAIPGLELATEVWYPARRGADVGADPKVYDVRLWLPPDSQDLVPDADNPWQPCECAADLPLDDQQGPYPVVVFLHGTAAFRTQSLSQMVHWASRGFVVIASDHAGLYLGDMLALQFGADLQADTDALLAALAAPSGDLAFLDGRIDTSRMAIVGHSAGGSALAGMGGTTGVRVLVPMAAGGVEPGSSLESVLVMGAVDDGVVDYQQQVSGYDSSPPRKRLVGIANAGHLAFSDLCELKNAEGQDLVEVAQEHQVPNSQFATQLWDGCDDGQTPEAEAGRIVRHATTVVLEEALQCQPTQPGLSGLEDALPLVAELREELD